METGMEETARTYLATKAEIEDLQESLKSLEETLKEAMLREGAAKIEVDGKAITLVQAERRSFDASVLKDLVSAAIFKQVTEPTVKTTLFDAAVNLGKIRPDVAEQVTSKTPYSQLRVK
jgi:class 3 adenylate cyclase